jgi:hypothetical protein
MAITIQECSNTKDGCRIAFHPGEDIDMVIIYFEKVCDDNGWQAGSADRSVEERIVIDIKGPTCTEFGSKLSADPEFDFTLCKGCR